MRAILAAMVLAVAFILPNLSHAQQQEPFCQARDNVVGSIVMIYGETLQKREERADGSVAEFWLNEKEGNWTITITSPDGLITCAVQWGVQEVGEPA